MSVYSELVDRLAPDGLSSQQRAELDAIRSAAQIDDNDPTWVHILPLYLLSNRREQARVDQEAVLNAIRNVADGIDVEKLGRRIVRHIDVSEIEVPPPEINTNKIAQAVAKAAAPALESALADRVVKLDTQGVQDAIRGAVSDTLFSWQTGAAVAFALLMTIGGYWWGGNQAEQRDRLIIAQLQAQVQQAQSEAPRGDRRR